VKEIKMTYQAWSWVVASVWTRRGFAARLRQDFARTLAECPYDDLTDKQRRALLDASQSKAHQFCVWLNWLVYDIRRLLGVQASPRQNGPWWPG
jgi:hypothetical protein